MGLSNCLLAPYFYKTASSICDLFSDNDISMSSLIAIGCDGTAVNTGKNAGTIRQLELYVKHPSSAVVHLHVSFQ